MQTAVSAASTGKRGEAALHDAQPAASAFSRATRCTYASGDSPACGGLVHVAAAQSMLAKEQDFEVHADLLQQLAPAGAARGEIDARQEWRHGEDLDPVVGMIVKDRKGAIKLLGDDDAYQCMRKRQAREP